MITRRRYRQKIAYIANRSETRDEWPRLTIYIGDRRSGKTNNALVDAEILLELTPADHIYFVVPANVSETPIDDELSVIGITDNKAFVKRLSRIRNSVVIIDEALIAVNARDRMRSVGTAIAKKIAIAAHRRTFFMLTTQAHRIDVQIREEADVVVIKKTKLTRLTLLDRYPKRIIKINDAFRRWSSLYGQQRTIETLKKTEAITIGIVTDFVYNVPKSKYIDKLSKRANEADIRLQ